MLLIKGPDFFHEKNYRLYHKRGAIFEYFKVIVLLHILYLGFPITVFDVLHFVTFFEKS